MYYLFLDLEIIVDELPLHVGDLKSQVTKTSLTSFSAPSCLLRSYYGDKVAIYFSWLSNYSRWLSVPGLAGLTLYLLSHFYGESKIYYTLYSLFVMIWAQFYIISWKRKESELLVAWDNYTDEYAMETHNRLFKGTLRLSPISGKYEKFYPEYMTAFRVFLSLLQSLPLLLLAIGINVFCLNLGGSIKRSHKSIIEVKYLIDLNE